MNYPKLVRFGSLLFLLFSLNIITDAQGRRDYNRRRGYESRWEQLGRSYVDGRRDHDRIFVNHRGSFRQLQLGIKGGTIEFQRVVVHFDNGGDHELDVRDRIRQGEKTRVIDLPGDRRRIRSVEFWYSKDSWRSRPSVNLWGRR
jgi:hypothetical protein